MPIPNLNKGRRLIRMPMRARRICLATKSIKAMMESKREPGSLRVTKNARLVVISDVFSVLWPGAELSQSICTMLAWALCTF
jgi:hypothetical protein